VCARWLKAAHGAGRSGMGWLVLLFSRARTVIDVCDCGWIQGVHILYKSFAFSTLNFSHAYRAYVFCRVLWRLLSCRGSTSFGYVLFVEYGRALLMAAASQSPCPAYHSSSSMADVETGQPFCRQPAFGLRVESARLGWIPIRLVAVELRMCADVCRCNRRCHRPFAPPVAAESTTWQLFSLHHKQLVMGRAHSTRVCTCMHQRM
jgi:hypothetical protein